MTKLQAIFKAVVTNSARMERVVDDVRQSVQTSNSSVSDLSALTEELSATMQDISENASVINTNTDNVAKEVELIAEKTDGSCTVNGVCCTYKHGVNRQEGFGDSRGIAEGY